MDKRIIIGLVIVVILLIGFLVVSKVTTSIQEKYETQGIKICIDGIIDRLYLQGYVDLELGEAGSIRLIPLEDQ